MAAPAITPPPPHTPPAPNPPPMTAEEFGLRYSGETRVEYINDVVVRLPMAGSKHGQVNNLAAYHLTGHVLANDLGRVFSTDTFVKVPTPNNPNRVYGADVCYVPYTKLAKDADVPDGVLPVTPDLVVETRSPSDTWAEVFGKAQDYLNVGVPVVVVLDPGTKTASVCTPPFDQRIVGPADTLTLPEVLPGFAVPLADLFG